MISRGSTLHEGVFELLYATARKERIAFTIEASGRATGTDADAVHASRAGVPTGLVMIPVRYMHSPVEMVDLQDVAAAARLIAAARSRWSRHSLRALVVALSWRSPARSSPGPCRPSRGSPPTTSIRIPSGPA